MSKPKTFKEHALCFFALQDLNVGIANSALAFPNLALAWNLLSKKLLIQIDPQQVFAVVVTPKVRKTSWPREHSSLPFLVKLGNPVLDHSWNRMKRIKIVFVKFFSIFILISQPNTSCSHPHCSHNGSGGRLFGAWGLRGVRSSPNISCFDIGG